jgi:hypothetical protein
MERIRAVLAARMTGNRRRLNRQRRCFVFLRKLTEKQGAPRRRLPLNAWAARRAAMEPAPVYHQKFSYAQHRKNLGKSPRGLW